MASKLCSPSGWSGRQGYYNIAFLLGVSLLIVIIVSVVTFANYKPLEGESTWQAISSGYFQGLQNGAIISSGAGGLALFGFGIYKYNLSRKLDKIYETDKSKYDAMFKEKAKKLGREFPGNLEDKSRQIKTAGIWMMIAGLTLFAFMALNICNAIFGFAGGNHADIAGKIGMAVLNVILIMGFGFGTVSYCCVMHGLHKGQWNSENASEEDDNAIENADRAETKTPLEVIRTEIEDFGTDGKNTKVIHNVVKYGNHEYTEEMLFGDTYYDSKEREEYKRIAEDAIRSPSRKLNIEDFKNRYTDWNDFEGAEE